MKNHMACIIYVVCILSCSSIVYSTLGCRSVQFERPTSRTIAQQPAIPTTIFGETNWFVIDLRLDSVEASEPDDFMKVKFTIINRSSSTIKYPDDIVYLAPQDRPWFILIQTSSNGLAFVPYCDASELYRGRIVRASGLQENPAAREECILNPGEELQCIYIVEPCILGFFDKEGERKYTSLDVLSSGEYVVTFRLSFPLYIDTQGRTHMTLHLSTTPVKINLREGDARVFKWTNRE